MTGAQSTSGIGDAVGRIEHQLAALWLPIPGEPPKARASTMNLVALAGAITDELVACIDAVGASHPARALVLAAVPELSAWEVEPEVRAICREEPDGEVICFERATLRLGSEAARRGDSIVAALSLGELPTVILALPGAPADVTEALVPTADRVIVDSRGIPLETIAALLATTPGYFADLGWIEMFPWRDLTARVFDDPAWLPMLRALDEIEVRHAARDDGKTPPDVRLYMGWLASRLGFRLASLDRARSEHGEIALRIGAEPASPHGVGSILSIALRGHIDGAEHTVRIERLADDGGFACSTSQGGESSRHLFRLVARDDAWLLTRALDIAVPDGVLREAIHAAEGWRR